MSSDPYKELANLPKFVLTSEDIANGFKLSPSQLSASLGGQDMSPQLAWSGFPADTKSFVVTMYDPDAPRPGGFWHWAVANLPANLTELTRGADSAGGHLPVAATAINNDSGLPTFAGAAPPVGTGRHRYFFVVYALGVEKLELPKDITIADLSAKLQTQTLAWASLVPWYEQN